MNGQVPIRKCGAKLRSLLFLAPTPFFLHYLHLQAKFFQGSSFFLCSGSNYILQNKYILMPHINSYHTRLQPRANFVLDPSGQMSVVSEEGGDAQGAFQYPSSVSTPLSSSTSLASTSLSATTASTSSVITPSSSSSVPTLSSSLPVDSLSSSASSSFSSTSDSSSASVTVASSTSVSSAAITTASSSTESPTVAATSSFQSTTDTTSAASPTTPPALAAPTVSPSGTNYATVSTHSPPFFVGIIFGTIVAIAILAALVAWYFRLKSNRRKQDELFRDANGDRDVGEPKRDDTFIGHPSLLTTEGLGASVNNVLASPIWSMPPPPPPVAAAYPFRLSPVSSIRATPVPILRDSVAYPLPLPSQNMLPLPEASFRAASPHSFQVTRESSIAPSSLVCPSTTYASSYNSRTELLPREFGTPRQAMDRPRFLSLESGRGLRVPWRRQDSGQGGWETHHEVMETNNQDHSAAAIQGSNIGGWTASLRANIMNALGSVMPTSSPWVPASDHLTPAPLTRKEKAEGQDKEWKTFFGGELIGDPDWASDLEATLDSNTNVSRTGTLADYKGGDHAFSPNLSRETTVVQPVSRAGSAVSLRYPKKAKVTRLGSSASGYSVKSTLTDGEEAVRRALAERRKGHDS
ncbi:uncharacterized protein EV420DRAFT_1501054 [Desarmillaria tabescens]|uniref:Uncharacterized protein n=1 Tax=Armillaria tabescens TaxID=1929756 RepID=A0AA39TVK1_ARMTA|nr:uncharacterized protein EV420DRAFT_1501054 [Desarmillaria tabescens]KAK0467728.1 hypothetical protein EV420DRAFT_1501054 [Desarmillaria tabescens]